MPIVYEIRVEGCLEECWSEWLGGLSIRPLPDGNTLLSGPVTDHTALYGLLNRLRDMNLKLICVDKKSEVP